MLTYVITPQSRRLNLKRISKLLTAYCDLSYIFYDIRRYTEN
jgi:hypothetical protein